MDPISDNQKARLLMAAMASFAPTAVEIPYAELMKLNAPAPTAYGGHGRTNRGPARAAPPIKPGAVKVGRNDPCPCGSGKKFKKCCYGVEHE